MKDIAIRPAWTIQDADGAALSMRLIELLVQVHGQGSLLMAAKRLGLSYRHAWDLVRQGEAQFGAPLLHMERGKGSTLTELGEKIVWADHRIHARLKPSLDSLASELAAELGRALRESAPLLRLHASHGFAIERLVQRLRQDGLRSELTYGNCATAAAAVHDGECDVAGFHLPIGPMQDTVLAHYAQWLAGEELTVIDIATRRQGLMVRAGNPKEVFALADLQREDVRFINRQAGSGTRLLLEALLRAGGIPAGTIAGFEHGEYTHAAVAAYVASGMADVGFGVETPARQFKLDFVPLASERYFLLCRTALLATPVLQQVLDVLRHPAFRQELAALPGYDGLNAGQTLKLQDAFPALGCAS
ncbi:substrate-binding domain-containing protein [Azohydromonas lata]|uniref:helix-turn-helix transcriptional regulator n=1 Tax=Azohydromonas lata TaxID=45677 RepID=UPI0008297AEA|nr:substrate-binding domain-containing protein [Azohydromonas lata]